MSVIVKVLLFAAALYPGLPALYWLCVTRRQVRETERRRQMWRSAEQRADEREWSRMNGGAVL